MDSSRDMQADIVTNVKGIQAITNKEQVEAAKYENLTVGDKPVLIARGGDTAQTCGIIYREFSRREDRTGNRFRFSKSKRGIVEVDPVWGNDVKVTPTKMETYIKEWFCLVELVPTRALGEVLILVDELPKMATALWQQSRYAGLYAPMFELTD